MVELVPEMADQLVESRLSSVKREEIQGLPFVLTHRFTSCKRLSPPDRATHEVWLHLCDTTTEALSVHAMLITQVGAKHEPRSDRVAQARLRQSRVARIR